MKTLLPLFFALQALTNAFIPWDSSYTDSQFLKLTYQSGTYATNIHHALITSSADFEDAPPTNQPKTPTSGPHPATQRSPDLLFQEYVNFYMKVYIYDFTYILCQTTKFELNNFKPLTQKHNPQQQISISATLDVQTYTSVSLWGFQQQILHNCLIYVTFQPPASPGPNPRRPPKFTTVWVPSYFTLNCPPNPPYNAIKLESRSLYTKQIDNFDDYGLMFLFYIALSIFGYLIMYIQIKHNISEYGRMSVKSWTSAFFVDILIGI
jgi:hypothetical protein